MTLDKRAIFVPAVGPQFFSYWKKNLTYKGFDFKWFTASSFFQYRYALISASFGINNAWYWRDETGYPKDGLLMTDSGGYQIASYERKGMKAKISSEASLRWQENNSDIGFNLDVPLTDNSFDACLNRSLANFQLFERKRRNYNMKLYNVLHGRDLQEIEAWYAAVKDFDFDGWAIGVKGNIYTQILAYLVLHEKDAPNLQDNIHIFGTANLQSMIALAMLSKHFNTAITFDSSTYSRASGFRDWYLPMDVRHKLSLGRNAERSMVFNPCKCPVCSNSTLDDLYSQIDPRTSLLIALHNLYQFIKVNEIIDMKVENEAAFQEYVEGVGEKKLVENINRMLEEYEFCGTKRVLKECKLFLKLEEVLQPSMVNIPQKAIA
jgi:tRNA-guanine family transglycosylase